MRVSCKVQMMMKVELRFQFVLSVVVGGGCGGCGGGGTVV